MPSQAASCSLPHIVHHPDLRHLFRLTLDSNPCCLALQAITTSVNFIFSFVIGQVYLTMLCHLEFGTYIFFAFWVAVMTLYAMFFLPETKGVPVEEMGFVWR